MTGLTRDYHHRYSWEDGPKMPGVTSITAMLDKSGALVGWSRRETAKYAVEHLDLLATMVKDFGPEETIRTVKTVTDKEAKDKAKIGTNVHAMIEAYLRAKNAGVVAELAATEEEAPFMEQFLRWERDAKVKWLTVEFMVASLEHSYGGTGDSIGLIDGAVVLIDVKTGRTLQPSMKLQLAGLRWAEFIGRPNDPKRYRIPAIERFALLHVRPDMCELVYQDVTPADYAAFLHCRGMWEWQQAQPDEWRDRKAA